MPQSNRKSKTDLDEDARLPTSIKVLLVLVFLLFIAGGAGIVYLTINNQNATAQANATATAQANATTVAHATATAKANASSTAIAQANANATVTAIAQANANATATANATVPFKVRSITISVSPASIAGMTCGTLVNVTYTATITVASGSPGGTVQLTWHIGSSTSPASATFGPGETSKTVSFTDSGSLAANNSFPRNGSITSTSPNVVNSTTIRPAGTCV